MNGLLDDRIIPAVMKFTNTKAIQAMKDGMLLVIPFLITGSLFMLLANLPYQPLADAITDCGLAAVFSQISSSSFSLMSLFAVTGIAHTYIKNENIPTAFVGSLIALSSFVILMPPSLTSENGDVVGSIISKDWTAGKGMICAIVVGLLVGWSYSAMIRKGWRITMPAGVPQGVADSFTALLPTVVIITVTGVVCGAFRFIADTSFLEWIYTAIQTPLQGAGDSFGGVMLMTVVMSVLWWCGVHGGSICGAILYPILQSNMSDNQAILDAGKELTVANGGRIFTQQFWDNYLCMTGAGLVIGIVVYICFFAKAKNLRELGKLSLVPNLFNISEPLVFGVPIVLNFYLLIPFILVPVITAASSYLLMSIGVLPLFSGVMVPWTTPPIISGFLVGGWRVALWQLILLIMSVIVYFPFMRKVDNDICRQLEAAEQES